MAVKQKHRAIVKKATIAAGGIGIPGAFSFGLDVSALSATWVVMILAIANKSEHEIDRLYALKLTAGVLAGLGAYIAGSKVFTTLLNAIPGAGTLASMGINSILDALYTYKMGNALSTLFDTGGLEEANIEDMIKSLLKVIATVPSMEEAKDIILMMTEE